MKHILFISTWFPNKLSPFSGDFVQRHAKSVATLNKVTVLHVVGLDSKPTPIIEENIESDKYKEIYVYYKKTKYSWLNAIKKFNAYQKGYKLLDKPDLIHANVIYTNLAWVLYIHLKDKIPFIISEHWTGYHFPKQLKAWRKRLSIQLGKKASYVVPVSSNLKFAMQNCGIRANYTVVPNVVDTQRFKPNVNNNPTPQFLHLSMLDDQHKNISGMLEAARILKEKNYQFIFKIGGNGDISYIKEKVDTYGLTAYVKTFGAVNHTLVPNLFNDADCFILFSNKENQPCVIIESFATGTPVIASNIGGIPEFFPNNFGLLVEPKSVDQLADAMEKVILKTVDFANKVDMHQYAKENFSVNSIAQQFDGIYSKAMNNK